MSSPSAFNCRSRSWRAALRSAPALLTTALFSSLGVAQPAPAVSAEALLTGSATAVVTPAPLAAVPNLRLALPALLNGGAAASEALVRSGWLAYWHSASVPVAWRGFSEDELRLEVETGRWQLGPLSVSTQLSSTPERERLCQPHCDGLSWSSSVRLKYDTGDIGPLLQTGPELELGRAAPAPRTRALGLEPPASVDSWFLRGGFSGKF